MKITKNELLGRMEYLFNVTGTRFDLSSQCHGNGRGYSVMLYGSHIMTHGHVTARELDSAITAFTKGFYFKEKTTLASFPSSQSCA